jgi:DNA-binding MarR family transcriptional regulator
MPKKTAKTTAARVAARGRRTKALPGPDTAQLEGFVGYNLRRAAGVQSQRFKAVFGPHNIRPVQLSILTMLHHNPELKQAMLGKALDIKRANVVTLLDELEGRGLVTRKPSETDRRSHVLEFTAAGRKLTTKLLGLHAKLENDLVRALGGAAARDQLLALLKAYRDLEPDPDIE